MTTRILIAVLFASIALAGCGRKNEREGYAFGCPIGMEKKIRDKETLLEEKVEPSGEVPYVTVTDIRCAERNQNMLIEVDLTNDGKDEHRVAYRFRWLDKDGMKAIDDEVWKPVMVYGKTRYTVSTNYPTQPVADFRFQLRSLDKP
jgi:uncharacterized protein YcfL